MNKPRPMIEDGLYFGLPEDAYYAADGLSNSGIKQLAVSPLNYWHCNLDPQAEPQEETYPQMLGKAVHCRLLEPLRFGSCYAAKLDKADHPDALDTVDDLKAFCEANGLPAAAKRKQELIDRIAESGLNPVVWDALKSAHSEESEGKRLLTASDMAKVQALAEAVEAEPYAKALLTGGVAEVSIFVTDPDTGVRLKGRADYMRPDATVDLKTFSNSRGKPIDRVVNDAIYYEGYHQQAAFYQRLRALARRLLASGAISTHGEVSEAWIKAFIGNDSPGFGFLFVESARPFDLRIVQVTPSERAGGERNVYWVDAEDRIGRGLRLYRECVARYGDRPWRDPQPPRLLVDTDLPQLMFA